MVNINFNTPPYLQVTYNMYNPFKVSGPYYKNGGKFQKFFQQLSGNSDFLY